MFIVQDKNWYDIEQDEFVYLLREDGNIFRCFGKQIYLITRQDAVLCSIFAFDDEFVERFRSTLTKMKMEAFTKYRHLRDFCRYEVECDVLFKQNK